MTVTVIIPVYNDASRLEKCLKALHNQSLDQKMEVLVIDNDSEEDIRAVTDQFEEVAYHVERGIGSYAARNCGLTHASGDIIAFTDADCIPNKDWLKNGISFLEHNSNCDVAGGRIDIFPQSDSPGNIEFYDMIFGFRQKESIEHHNYSVTANLFVRKRNFDRIGLFDSKLKSGGDAEWCQRLIKNKGTLCYASKALIKHPALGSFKKFLRKYKRIAGGRYQKDGFDFYRICRASYYHLLSMREIWREIHNNSLIDSTFKKMSIVSVHFLKINIYIVTYLKIYIFQNLEREWYYFQKKY